MTELVSYHARYFVDKLKSKPGFSDWASIYRIIEDKNTALNDRTGKFSFGIRTVVPDYCSMPVYNNRALTYRECAIDKVKDILQKHDDSGLPIVIMYSGGIDSSVIISAFIDYLGVDQASKKITILMNRESIDENQILWQKFIRPYFNIRNSDYLQRLDYIQNCIYVTGELNDQLHGLSEVQHDMSIIGNEDVFTSALDYGMIVDYFIKGKHIEKQYAEKWAMLFFENYKSCPNPINNLWNMFWWANFTWKWINVYHRIFLFSHITGQLNVPWIKKFYCPFFASDQFQLWAIHNNEPKVETTWNSYKPTAKRYVCDVIGSDDFMEKVKRPSLRSVWVLRKFSYGIDKDYKIIDLDNIDLDKVSNPYNSLINYC